MLNINLKPDQIPKKESGFITLEVVVSMILGLAFLAVSLQSIGYALAIKVQAQEKQRANELIQEDIERISQLGSNTALGGTCNPANYAGGYAQALWDALEPNPPSAENPPPTKTLSKSIKADGSDNGKGDILALQRFHFNDAVTNRAPFRTLKVAYRVWTWDADNSQFTDKNGNIPDGEDFPISETFVEVIPDVALSCP
ncbi:MAG: hypothetical protein WBM44_02875 [Waterburya sp.]